MSTFAEAFLHISKNPKNRAIHKFKEFKPCEFFLCDRTLFYDYKGQSYELEKISTTLLFSTEWTLK